MVYTVRQLQWSGTDGQKSHNSDNSFTSLPSSCMAMRLSCTIAYELCLTRSFKAFPSSSDSYASAFNHAVGVVHVLLPFPLFSAWEDSPHHVIACASPTKSPSSSSFAALLHSIQFACFESKMSKRSHLTMNGNGNGNGAAHHDDTEGPAATRAKVEEVTISEYLLTRLEQVRFPKVS